jgi:2-polyprenyl-3-methyl-5-hydroxy-6-metoxy-1,4-benzoquinol methylase
MASGGAKGDVPTLAEQVAFWNHWNQEFRGAEIDWFMARQRDLAVEVAAAEQLRDARILDVGCGTGWLGHALLRFGTVTGTDLSPSSIERGRTAFPGVDLRCGDFLDVPLDGPFDLVVSADVISHVYDQARFVARIAELLRPGGVFVLMTQNAFVWNRSSRLRPVGRGQIRNWPSLRRVRALLEREFRIERITSLVPGGDRGVLIWVDNRFVLGAMRRLLPGRGTWVRWLEAARLGRELVYVARRR